MHITSILFSDVHAAEWAGESLTGFQQKGEKLRHSLVQGLARGDPCSAA